MNKPVLFQNMPPLSPEEYSELEASIKEHGIQVPILIDEDGVVIDGHHRQKIAQELGIRCPKRQVIDKTESEKRTLALSLNVHRRHLTREQKRALIAESIKADPQLPDLQHAHRTGASDKTVTSVRRELEAHSEIPNDIPRVNARGQERPASYEREQPDPKSDAELLAGAEWSPEAVEPEPKPEPQKPRRNPLPDQARTAGWEVRKSVERIERIMEDDRFTRNKEEVAAHLRGPRQYAIETLQTTLAQLN